MTTTKVTRTIHRGILVIPMAVFATADVCADATWKTAANGDWRVDSNWVDSIAPSSSGRTYITNAAAAYTVTLGSGADVTSAGLKISGKTSPSYQTKLNISDTKLIVDGAQPSVSYGAVTVGSGAELEIKNAAGANLLAPLPLTFDGTADIANLASWSVAIDGVVTRRYKILVEEGTFRLVPYGTTIVIQ